MMGWVHIAFELLKSVVKCKYFKISSVVWPWTRPLSLRVAGWVWAAGAAADRLGLVLLRHFLHAETLSRKEKVLLSVLRFLHILVRHWTTVLLICFTKSLILNQMKFDKFDSKLKSHNNIVWSKLLEMPRSFCVPLKFTDEDFNWRLVREDFDNDLLPMSGLNVQWNQYIDFVLLVVHWNFVASQVFIISYRLLIDCRITSFWSLISSGLVLEIYRKFLVVTAVCLLVRVGGLKSRPAYAPGQVENNLPVFLLTFLPRDHDLWGTLLIINLNQIKVSNRIQLNYQKTRHDFLVRCHS